MHTEDMKVQDLDIPFVDLDIPFVELQLDELPSIDEVLQNNQVRLSPPPTAGQTPYTERISIRIPRWLLSELKVRAGAIGMPYQTFINQVLAQHAGS